MKAKNRLVETRFIDSTTVYGKNDCIHSKAQIGQLRTFRRFLCSKSPLIRPKMGVMAGHARLKAPRRLGIADVPSITLDGLSDFHIMTYAIAYDRFALNAG